VRIIAGAMGGRRLKTPQGAETRPTSDRVREALFSILGAPDAETRVLDLFAGAGTLGLEAISRGAARATFVDNSRAALRVLRDNISALGVGDRCDVRGTEALRTLRRLQEAGEQFDWIFLDPPYATDLADQALQFLAEGTLFSPTGIIVVEHDRRRPPASEHGSLVRTDCRRYGDTVLSFFESR
jgi:16S rRNA (guanine(966)-N(2))-methyltransferase RsmD